MHKKLKILLAAAAAAMCAVFIMPGTASAATAEEAAELARQHGIPDNVIQEAWNRYNKSPEDYSESTIDAYISCMEEANWVIVSNQPYEPDKEIPALTTETTSVQQSETTTAAAVQGDPGNGAQTVSTDITLTMPDGSSFTRISSERFIALSYEDKMSYIGTFTPEQQDVIIKNLSSAEYKSMMKQMPNEKKLEYIDTLTPMLEDLGITATVDELDGNSVSISMKNQDGQLISVSKGGKNLVENTGYDRRGLFGFTAVSLAAAMAGIYFIARKFFVTDEKEAENE